MKFRNQSGQTLTEYLVLLMLVAIVGIAAARTFGKSVKAKIEEAQSAVDRL